ncbi:S-adenosyl-L-methionine-dependent methyltransferase [Lasiosphaeria hispida]|uniref:tRNA wybutosine-synthesizing protein 2 n=1 Tax=Lasiosphaeria hispida TaxID=260671 RepID=A0AAJ0H993_9PEZI|nr:S-adenosyl-L-methionine-dependent methyltransferase [Lasiosphaeria hispida]
MLSRAPPQKRQNPIAAAVSSWLQHVEPSLVEPSTGAQLVEKAPKRWVVYEPMVLLPSGSFTSAPWPALLGCLGAAQQALLWEGILQAISSASAKAGPGLTHLAVNEGIPLHVADPQHEQQTMPTQTENLLRSPSGLRMLHGDFGPAGSQLSATSSQTDFAAALWVSTKQNGIAQTWAPRWTMFSRGNVKEKARLLGFHSELQGRRLTHRHRSRDELRDKWAVDLYAGIGYFVFSYARLGLRVLCWELNPWSVEGLRRGAKLNKWSVRVVRGGDELSSIPTAELVAGLDEQIIVFLEDNMEAERRVAEFRASGPTLDVLHVNCGFLPTSLPTWRPAWAIQTQGRAAADGWLHLHENVGIADIEHRRKEIQAVFDQWDKTAESGANSKRANVELVELVKTFAPDVWHCVFDVHITDSRVCNEGRLT